MPLENPFIPYQGEDYTNNGMYYFDPARIGQGLSSTPNYFYTGGSPGPAQTSGGGNGSLAQWYIGPNGQLMSTQGPIPSEFAGSGAGNTSNSLAQWYIGPNGQLMSTQGPIPSQFAGPAPTQSQVNANPSQFAGTSFDPARYLTYPGSPYGNGTGNGNPNTGMFASQGGGRGNYPQEPGQVGDTYTGPRPDPTRTYGNGYWNAQNDPQGFNHNIYAPFLSQNTDINTPQGRLANIISQMLTSGEAPMRQAQAWLQANVRPGATSMNPGADGSGILQSWGRLNGSSPNGNATPGVNNLGNGIDPNTGFPVDRTTRVTQGTGSNTGIFPGPDGLTVNSGGTGEGGGGNQGPQYRILQMPNGQQYRYRLTGNQAIDDREIARLQASWAAGGQGEGGGGQGTQGGGTNSALDSYNNQLDLVARFSLGLPEGATVTDAMRRQLRMPSRTELQMNQQYRQQHPDAPSANGFYNNQLPTDAPFLPTSAAPSGFNWRWLDPDGAGINPGNFALSLANAPTDYASYTNLFNTAMDPTYGNKLLDFTLGNGRYSGMFGGQGPLNQSDFQRLMTQAQSPFYGTPLGGGSALGNYIASTGNGQNNIQNPAVSHALAGTAYDPGNDPRAPGYTPPAPITRDWATYPGSGVAGGNNSLTSANTTTPTGTGNTPVTLPPTGDQRPPRFNDSAYYPSTL